MGFLDDLDKSSKKQPTEPAPSKAKGSGEPRSEAPKASKPSKAKKPPKPDHPDGAARPGEPCPQCGKVHRCSHGPKQRGRMLKAACPECSWAVRITRKQALRGLPLCPVCAERGLEHRIFLEEK